MIVEGKAYTVGPKVLLFTLAFRLIPGLGIFAALGLLSFSLPQIGTILDAVSGGGGSVGASGDLVAWIFKVGFLLFLLYTALVLVLTWLEYVTYTYSINPNGMVIESGILHRHERAVPFRQIQNIEVKRSLLFRFFGLSRFVIVTAAHEDSSTPQIEAEVVIPILDKVVCQELREKLLERTHTQRVQHI